MLTMLEIELTSFFSWLFQSLYRLVLPEMILSPVAIWFAWMFGVDHNNKVEQVTTKNDKADTTHDEEVEDPDGQPSSRQVTKLRPDAPPFVPPYRPIAKPFLPSGRLFRKTKEQQNAEAANSKTFRWPQQSPMIQNLRDGATKGAALDENVVEKLQELGIYRNDGVENTDGDDNNVVDAARKCGKNVPRNKVRMLFDTFAAHARDGLEKTEDVENLVKIVAYRKKEKTKEKPKPKEDTDIINDWRVAGRKNSLNIVIRKDSLSLPTAIRSN